MNGGQAVHEIGSWRLTKDGKIYRRWKQFYANGDVYDGEWVDGLRHGRGKFFYKSGDSYIGEFENGLFHGYGTLIRVAWTHPYTKKLRGRQKFEGYFQAGKRHGKGILVIDKELSYEGDFVEDFMEGHGFCKYKDGTTYDGEWIHGKWNGIGKLEYPNGRRYEGEFRIGVYHGLGTLKYENKSGSYSGPFHYGEKHGSNAHCVFKNGTVFEGDYFHDYMQGQGTLIGSDGSKYCGQFYASKFHGDGLIIYVDGSFYEGQFLNGYFYGRGKFTYADGSFYEGEYMKQGKTAEQKKKDKQLAKKSQHASEVVRIKLLKQANTYTFPTPNSLRHGFGVRIFSNGNKYEGEWKDDLMNGKGKLTLRNGITIEGTFWNGKAHGDNIRMVLHVEKETTAGTEFPPGSRVLHHGRGTLCTYEGSLKLGEWHGKGKLTQRNEQNYDGMWKDGKRHGFGKQQYYASDASSSTHKNIMAASLYRIISYHGDFFEDRRHGHGRLYYGNGDSVLGSFESGHPHGKCAYIYAKSGRRRVGIWIRGTRQRWCNNEESASIILEKTTNLSSLFVNTNHFKETSKLSNENNQDNQEQDEEYHQNKLVQVKIAEYADSLDSVEPDQS